MPSSVGRRQYAYEARDGRGNLTTGTITAASRDHAGRLLSECDLFVVRLADHTSRRRTGGPGRASRSQIAWQIWQLSVMVESGLPLSESLECLARQTSRPALRALLENVSRTVQAGQPLSEAMAAHPQAFPASLVAMIRASEATGTLGMVLRRCAGYLVRDLQIVRRMHTAVAYPIFMLIACVAVLVLLLTYVLPRFTDLFAARGATLPLPTRLLIQISENVLSHWPAWTIAAVLVPLAVVAWLRTAIGRRVIDYLAIALPVIGPLFNALYQSRTFRAISLLLETRVPLVESMKIIQDVVPNTYYRRLWRSVDDQIQIGERFAAPLLRSTFIAEPVAQMIDNADRTGQLDTTFDRLADFMEEQYERMLAGTMQFLEPCLILVIGAMIGFMAIAMLLPLFRTASVVTGQS